MALDAAERIALTANEDFRIKVKAAVMKAAYEIAKGPTELEAPERLQQLSGLFKLYDDPKFLADFVARVTLFFVGAAAVIADGLNTSDADLETIATEAFTALEELTTVGGSWIQ